MRKILVKSLLVIIEAGIQVPADRIKKQELKNGNHHGLVHLRDGRGAYGLRHQTAAHHFPVAGRRRMKRSRGTGALYLLSEGQTGARARVKSAPDSSHMWAHTVHFYR